MGPLGGAGHHLALLYRVLRHDCVIISSFHESILSYPTESDGSAAGLVLQLPCYDGDVGRSASELLRRLHRELRHRCAASHHRPVLFKNCSLEFFWEAQMVLVGKLVLI